MTRDVVWRERWQVLRAQINQAQRLQECALHDVAGEF
jgi:hypothetical protein